MSEGKGDERAETIWRDVLERREAPIERWGVHPYMRR